MTDRTPSPATAGLLTEHDRDDLLLGHHDGLCPEGPDCRSRWLHAQSPTIYASLTPALLATFEGILADRIARAILAAHSAPPSEHQQRADHYQYLYEQASEGKCGHSGLTIGACKASICDCFEFPWVQPAPAEHPDPAPPSETATEDIEDGFGGYWTTCGPGCDLQTVRPGKVQCNRNATTCPDLPVVGERGPVEETQP